MAFLLDTNVLIYHLGGDARMARWMQPTPTTRPAVSVITRIEVLAHHSVAGTPEPAVRRLLDSLETLGLSDSVIERTVRLRRDHRLKLPDAIIAATAVASDRVLVTNDLRGFAAVPGLRLAGPFASAAPDARDRGPRYRKSTRPNAVRKPTAKIRRKPTTKNRRKPGTNNHRPSQQRTANSQQRRNQIRIRPLIKDNP